MSNDTLNASQVKDMFLYVGKKVIENKPLLTDVDGAIGDGDHGIGMEVGFTKAEGNLNKKEFTNVNDVFKTIGMSMVTSMGGASGVLFGTVFMGGVKDLDASEELSLPFLAEIFEKSLIAVKDRGKASVGDKTMIDALEPAVEGLKVAVNDSLNLMEGLKKAEAKAAQGVEDSKGYIAKFGRAKSLGDRAIGHQDAGATSIWIIFKSMREWMEGAMK